MFWVFSLLNCRAVTRPACQTSCKPEVSHSVRLFDILQMQERDTTSTASRYGNTVVYLGIPAVGYEGEHYSEHIEGPEQFSFYDVGNGRKHDI